MQVLRRLKNSITFRQRRHRVYPHLKRHTYRPLCLQPQVQNSLDMSDLVDSPKDGTLGPRELTFAYSTISSPPNLDSP